MSKTNTNYFLAVVLLVFSSTVFSQTLIDGAESVAFDSLNNRYLVTSLRTSKIISIDKAGNQSIFKEGITAFGNCTKDSILYVTGGNRIRGLDVFTGADVFSVSVPGVQQFDGITVDNSGNLYAMATILEQVYKINIKTNTYSLFVDGGFGGRPQDIIFDKFKNRILVCHWSTDSPIMAISLEDSVLSTVVENSPGFADGITIDQHGNIYVTSYGGEGEIYMYDNDFSEPGKLIYVGVEEPAGLDYNIIDDVLAVPSFVGDKVVFINMPPTYLFPKIGVNYKTGNAPLTLEFADLTSANPKITNWEWDFNNDGIIDSYEQNPEWVFAESGKYCVKASFSSDSLSKSITLEDSIIVFEGESSMNFISASSVVKVSPASNINLKDAWTFETWLNPTTLYGKYILDKNSVSIYTNKRSIGFNDNSLGIKLIREDDSIIRFTTEDSSLALNQWQHIAISYNYSTTKLEVYINGKIQEFNIDYNSIFDSPIKSNETDTLLIGNNFSGLRGLLGKLDEIRIWNRDLSKEEIDSNRYKYLMGSENNLSVYWKINEGNGNQIIDNTTNGNNGKIIGAQYDWGIDYDNLVGVKIHSSHQTYPNSFSLKQNYPNPFNPSTTIEYQIPVTQNSLSRGVQLVTLKIYNTLGQEIAALVQKEQKPGTYNVIFDASNLTSGIYFYKLSTNGFSTSKKMVLVR